MHFERIGTEVELRTLLAADAQTSGGLLMCVDEQAADGLVADLVDQGLPATRVGELAPARPDRPDAISLMFQKESPRTEANQGRPFSSTATS